MPSNGELLKTPQPYRGTVIARMKPASRMKLAHLASYGMRKALVQAREWEQLLLDLTFDYEAEVITDAKS
jgi:hypothetical protein